MVDPKILAETEDYLVIDKPAGWVVNTAESVTGLTIQEWSGAYPVHRLDKDTSGVLLIAKNEPALAEFQRQFKQRLTKKTYEALLHGRLEPKDGAINLPVGRSKLNRHKFCVRVDGKQAETAWQVLEYVEKNGKWFTKVRLFPKTGRTHQLRVHMAHLKHSIVGDPIYSRSDGGLRLRAKKLCFEYKGELVCYEV